MLPACRPSLDRLAGIGVSLLRHRCHPGVCATSLAGMQEYLLAMDSRGVLRYIRNPEFPEPPPSPGPRFSSLDKSPSVYSQSSDGTSPLPRAKAKALVDGGNAVLSTPEKPTKFKRLAPVDQPEQECSKKKKLQENPDKLHDA